MKPLRHRLLFTYTMAVLAFLYIPIVVLVLYSFNASRINAQWSGFTFDWYISAFQNRYVMEALYNSLTIALIAMIVSTVLGTMTALALHRYKFRWKGAIHSLIYLPILIPEIVMGLSLLVLFSQLAIPLGKLTVVIAHISFCISFVVIIVLARLEGLGKDLEEAAQDLGATPWQTFRYVTFPLISPGVLAGALMAFTLSIDDFVISFFVAGPNSTTLPLYIYGMVKRGVSPEINALSTLLILFIVIVTVALVILPERFQSRVSDKKAQRQMPF
ncbi:ABC transporter permease [Heliorestis convoluta]|uniref:Spermidine/putrescine abc transporter PotC, permease protein n=1 Tax=Heliorestis convoluta TaxID=356322 RepID=A0A5Q2N3H1_9FIRM|nr:ABC transporter permease [Heliorestis convoluta]QGG48409.1 Spermidine/putrescine abc transporter PotC, permease protein [Heliorestis convoluta]